MLFIPKGVCSRAINVEIEDGIIKDIKFTGGCAGNTEGVARLCKGMKAEEVIKRLKGIPCGMRPTSCPDQLARALEQYLRENK
ncbi:MAG: TIGR03905 family TSCPD domain-containing protein [Oscillospiraceae bacterium]